MIAYDITTNFNCTGEAYFGYEPIFGHVSQSVNIKNGHNYITGKAFTKLNRGKGLQIIVIS